MLSLTQTALRSLLVALLPLNAAGHTTCGTLESLPSHLGQRRTGESGISFHRAEEWMTSYLIGGDLRTRDSL